MKLDFIEAKVEDAKQLVQIYDAAFYSDYIRFGSCPGYGRTIEDMKHSIKEAKKYIITCDQIPVGVISFYEKQERIYEVGALCVVPEYQGRGIGTKAIEFIKKEYSDYKKIQLETPAQKEENVSFYTKKCGFKIVGEMMDGTIKLYCFELEQNKNEIEYKSVKNFKVEDLEELFQSVGWFSGQFPEKLKIALANSSHVFSAWDNERLVGLVRGLDDGIWQATIDCLLVHKDYQGQGIASQLLNMLLKEYEEFLYVDVVPDEKKNVAFYEKHGFSVMKEGTPLQIEGKNWKVKKSDL